jgi:hypothetical protein
MFSSDLHYSRAMKYYYGLWDRLCQRTETNWNREIIDKIWSIAEKIRSQVNREIKHATLHKQDELKQDLTVLFGPFIESGKQFHPLFDE